MKELYLVTGFLGAGKTTFLNMAARAFADRRIAVIVNEFGKQGVDGGLLSGKGYEVTEISNGSVFCVCRMDLFIDALTEAAKAPIDVLLVETSGLSDPTNIDDVLAQTKAVSGESFDYRGCICLVDAVHFEKVYETAVVIPCQIRQSSLIVINKTDLADAEKVEAVEGIIRSLNPACKICRTTYADIPRNLLAELEPVPGRVLGGKQDLLSGSLTFRVTGKPDISAFYNLIEGLKPLVYRCKGYAALADGNYFVDGVMEDVTVSRVETTAQDGIVLLYKTSGHVRKAVQRLAAEHWIQIELLK